MTKRIVIADAHTGVRWYSPEMQVLAHKRISGVLDLAERTGWPIIDVGDDPEILWRDPAELKEDPDFACAWSRMMNLDATLLLGNHNLKAPIYFPEAHWVTDYDVDGWHFEHGHDLDVNTFWQKPFYQYLPWVRGKTPWELSATNKDQYNISIASIQMRAAMKARELGRNVAIGHTHAYLNAEYTRQETGRVRVFNVPSITEDGMYAILEDSRMYLQRISVGEGGALRFAAQRSAAQHEQNVQFHLRRSHASIT